MYWLQKLFLQKAVSALKFIQMSRVFSSMREMQ